MVRSMKTACKPYKSLWSTLFAVLTVAGLVLAPSVGFADGGHGHHRDHHRGHQRGHHRGHRRGHQRHHRYGHRQRHWGPPRYYDPYGSGGSFSFFGSNRHSGFALSLPLNSYRSAPRTVYRAVGPVGVGVQPARPPVVASARSESTLPPGCEQTREFQTEIVIGGRRVPAYGTACLMPDDTWEQLGLRATR